MPIAIYFFWLFLSFGHWPVFIASLVIPIVFYCGQSLAIVEGEK